MDNKNELNIKSLKSFKEETLVHILPFRYRNDKLEILLHESIEEKNIFTDFAGLFMKMDVNQIFCAARILYNFFHENVFTLSLYTRNWTDHIFHKYLGIVSKSYEIYESDDQMHKIYFIEEKNLNEYSEKPLSVILRWFSLSEIISYPLRFSETFLNYTSLVNIEEHLNYPKKNYAVINCESLSIWNNVYEGLYQGYFQKPHEQWLSFNVTKGIFPNEDEIKKINGWIISGSDFSVYDETLVWLKDLFLLINDIIKIKGENARILGICFGHQALAQALGGKCEKMKNFLQMLTVKQNVIFNGKFWSKDFVKRSEISKKLLNKEGVLLNQSHGDHVCKLPPNAELFGSSENTEIESFGIGDQILSFQSHPEFSDLFMIYRFGWYDRIDSKVLIDSYTESEINNKEIIAICREFLNI